MKPKMVWRKCLYIFAIVVGVVLIAFYIFFMGKTDKRIIVFGFNFDDFKFLNRTLSEGDRMQAISLSSDIDVAYGIESNSDYYINENLMTKSLMCPAKFDNDDGNKSWMSAYVVQKSSKDGRISMNIDKVQTEYQKYYQGPIQIGDSFDKVYEYLHIDEIQMYGQLNEAHNRKYYTCDSNLGVITMKVEPTSFDDYYKCLNPKEYLEDGNNITYCIRFEDYYLNVTIDKEQKVSNINLIYDSNHVLLNSIYF